MLYFSPSTLGINFFSSVLINILFPLYHSFQLAYADDLSAEQDVSDCANQSNIWCDYLKLFGRFNFFSSHQAQKSP